MTKVHSNKQSKSKVKKADSQIVVNQQQHTIMGSSILDDQSILTYEGNAFAVCKHTTDLFEDGQLRKLIDLSQASENKAQVAVKNKQEDYQVVGMDEQVQLNPQF